ncbi:hypothetical protein GA0115260_1020518 [Streptomyces sp. MnatMP-M27]|nr:hypothetical protein GA0115260_1020518 [Streptomyces sp. MnatMP-M27]
MRDRVEGGEGGGEPRIARLDLDDQLGVRGGVRAAAEAEFEASAAEQVGHGGVLGRPYRILQGQDHHGGAEPDRLGALGDGREEHEGRGEPPVLGSDMVLGHP